MGCEEDIVKKGINAECVNGFTLNEGLSFKNGRVELSKEKLITKKKKIFVKIYSDKEVHIYAVIIRNSKKLVKLGEIDKVLSDDVLSSGALLPPYTALITDEIIRRLEKEIMNNCKKKMPLVCRQFRRKEAGNSWTRSQQIWEELPERKTWDFVGEFLPNYDNDSTVTYSNDLSCVLDGTWSREKFNGYYPDHQGDSLAELQKILESTDAGLYLRAEQYFDEAIKSGAIEVRELEMSKVSARIIEDTRVWLWHSHDKNEDGIWVDQEKLQDVYSRVLDEENQRMQVLYTNEHGKQKWMFAQSIDFL